MSEKKRFILAEDSNGLFSIFDNEDIEDDPLIYGAKFGTEKIVDLLNELVEENEIKKEELIQKKLTNVLLAKIYEAQLSLNPNLPYVGQSLKKEMQLLDKKISELCGDVFNE